MRLAYVAIALSMPLSERQERLPCSRRLAVAGEVRVKRAAACWHYTRFQPSARVALVQP